VFSDPVDHRWKHDLEEVPMHYVIIASHSAEICPTGNAKTRQLMLETAPDIPMVADKAGVKIIAGPYVNREHVSVAVVEAATGEALDEFLVGSRLPQWNSVRVLPSKHLEEGIQEIMEMPTVF
jgi:hypothetical protein